MGNLLKVVVVVVLLVGEIGPSVLGENIVESCVN
jgi:hypothetical protein